MINIAGIVRNLMPCPPVIEKDLCKKYERSTETMLLKHYYDSF